MKSQPVTSANSILAQQYNDLRQDAFAGSFLSPHQQASPNMTLYIEPGVVYVGTTKVIYAGGNTPTITGGTINGATVGATTPAAGKFTTLSASGTMTMNSLIVVGSNQTVGTATLANGTKTVSTTAVTAASEIFLTRKAASGTLGNLNITSQNAGANFTIGSGTATENSTVNWLIVN